MIEKGRDLLIEEYKTAWQMILNIDERRGKFIHYFSFVFIGVIGVVVNLLKDINLFDEVSTLCPSQVVMVNVLLFVATIVGLTVIYMLIAERAANIRYRKKVNLMRELLYKATDIPKDEYLDRNRKDSVDLGIKTFHNDKQPKGIGKTLRGGFGFVIIVIACFAAGLYLSWYYLPPIFIKIEKICLLLLLAFFGYFVSKPLKALYIKDPQNETNRVSSGSGD